VRNKTLSSLIGKNLRVSRQHRGMSQVKLALRLGVSRAAISNYEKGRQDFLISTLAKISYILDVPIHVLTGRR